MEDSNLRRRKPIDLQSIPFVHFGNCPGYPIKRTTNYRVRVEQLSSTTLRPRPIASERGRDTEVRRVSFGNRDEACYLTRLVLLRALRLLARAQCEALRREAGRCWSELVTLHRE